MRTPVASKNAFAIDGGVTRVIPSPAGPGVLPGALLTGNTSIRSGTSIAFRIGYHGAQGRYGGDPDLTVLGKIMGGGFPVGATGGRAEVMDVFDPGTSGPRILSGGTFSGNPVTMAAGLAAISLGLSILHKNDHEMLEHGMVMYDALYAWCKNEVGQAATA